MTYYGHPPDGKGGWYAEPHRLVAYDMTTHAVLGGIHWQNPNAGIRGLTGSEKSRGGYISAIAVSGEARGRGLGKLLMVAAVEQVLRDGAESSHLVVTQFGAQQTPHLDLFYARVGFIHQASRGLPPKPGAPPRAGLFSLKKIPADYGEKIFGSTGLGSTAAP